MLRRLFDAFEAIVLVVKLKRYEGLEAARLVLQLTQSDHVINPFIEPLDGTKQHGTVRAHAEPVRDAMDLNPVVAAHLVVAQLSRSAVREDLPCATARHGVQPSLPERDQDLLMGHPVFLRVVVYLHGREALDVQIGPLLLDGLEQVRIARESRSGFNPLTM